MNRHLHADRLTAVELVVQWSAFFAVALGCAVATAEESVPAQSEATGGNVEGVIVYRADSKRPWRYARYYVKSRKTGELAEAVVAISGEGLKESAPPHRPVTAVVDQQNFTFIPETTAIRAGDQVQFLNSDKQLHNVQAFHRSHSFNVTMPAGGKHVETFKQATGMRVPYRIGCVYHSAMRAWVFVLDHPWFQVTEADGTFKLANVPPGTYTLEVAHPAGELRWKQEIEVKAGETTRVSIELSPDNKPNQSTGSKQGSQE